MATKYYFHLDIDMLTFTERWSKYLASQPETGMGYQIAAIKLLDGRILNDCVIVDGKLVSIAGSPEIPFKEDQISEITVLRRR